MAKTQSSGADSAPEVQDKSAALAHYSALAAEAEATFKPELKLGGDVFATACRTGKPGKANTYVTADAQGVRLSWHTRDMGLSKVLTPEEALALASQLLAAACAVQNAKQGLQS